MHILLIATYLLLLKMAGANTATVAGSLERKIWKSRLLASLPCTNRSSLSFSLTQLCLTMTIITIDVVITNKNRHHHPQQHLYLQQLLSSSSSSSAEFSAPSSLYHGRQPHTKSSSKAAAGFGISIGAITRAIINTDAMTCNNHRHNCHRRSGHYHWYHYPLQHHRHRQVAGALIRTCMCQQ